MDGGAWWATVHGVAKSQTQLSDFTFTFHFHALQKETQPTPVFLPGEVHGQRRLVGYNLWGRKRVRPELVTKKQQYQFVRITNSTPLSVNKVPVLVKFTYAGRQTINKNKTKKLEK